LRDRGEAARLLEPLLKGDSVPTDWKLAYADALLGEDYRNVHQSALPATEQLRTAKAILSETLLAEPENIYAKCSVLNWPSKRTGIQSL